jgi:DNA modification methylase
MLDKTLTKQSIKLKLPSWSGTSSKGLNWQVINGPALETLKILKDNSADCLVTSPPYFWLRDYGVEGQLGLEDTVEEYVTAIADIMDEAKRVLDKEGLLFLNIGDTYYSGKGASQGQDRKSKKRRFGLRAVDKSGGMGIGLQRKSAIGIPWRVAIEMTSRGWVLRSSIVWHREKCLPEHVRDRPSRSYENVFMFAQNRRYYFDKQPLIDKKIEEDMWTIATSTNSKISVDTAPYPEELVRRCLEIGCKPGGTVLDPFLGSGTTSKVALEMGFSTIGVEINEEFCKFASELLNQV